MQKLEETVELAGSCFYNMLRTVIETIPREASGDILGKRITDSFICINAYPIQTADRKPQSVEYSDYKAVERVRRLNNAVNVLGGLGTHLIGGYHSHVAKKGRKIINKLSKEDLEHARFHLEELKMDYWIEVVLNLKIKKYKQEKPRGEFLIQYPRRLRVILRLGSSEAYDITISAFKVTNPTKPKVKKLGIKKRKVKVIQIKS